MSAFSCKKQDGLSLPIQDRDNGVRMMAVDKLKRVKAEKTSLDKMKL